MSERQSMRGRGAFNTGENPRVDVNAKDIEDFQEGNDLAFDAIWKREEPSIDRLLKIHIFNMQTREELKQEVAIKIFRLLRENYQIGAGKSVKSYILTAVRFTINDHIERQGRQKRIKKLVYIDDPLNVNKTSKLAQPGMSPEQIVDFSRKIESLMSCPQLSEMQKNMLKMYYFEGLTQREIADKTVYRKSRVDQILKLAIRKYQEWMGV